MIKEIMMTKTAKTEYKQDVRVIEGIVLATSSHKLPATKPAPGRKAKPERTMGIIGIVDANGTYTEVTDFSKQWMSLQLDKSTRLVVDRQEREKDDRTQVYHNLVRAVGMPAPSKDPVPAEA